MPTSSLSEFTQPVPVCQQTSSLAAVLEIFRASGCDTIVVVREQQRPLGVVNLRQVLPYLILPSKLGETPETFETVDYHQPISQLEPSLIEPLTILPAQLSLSQFCEYLQESGDQSHGWDRGHSQQAKCESANESETFTPSPHRTWAVVDENGKFLGLLDNWRVLKSLTPHCTATAADAGAGEQPLAANLQPLVQLLEQLPLPLSLQTTTGQVLAQNRSWRQQVGESPSLDWVRRTTAAMLDHASVQPRPAFIPENPVREKSHGVPDESATLPCACRSTPSGTVQETSSKGSDAPNVTTAGENVHQWLTRSQAAALTLSGTTPPECEVLRARGRRVTHEAKWMPALPTSDPSEVRKRDRDVNLTRQNPEAPAPKLSRSSKPNQKGSKSPRSEPKVAKQPSGQKAHKAAQQFCALDTPRMAATVSQRQAILSAPSGIKTDEAPCSYEEVSALSEETTKQSQERVFSFVKFPLSPSLVKEITKVGDWETQPQLTSKVRSHTFTPYPPRTLAHPIAPFAQASSSKDALPRGAMFPPTPTPTYRDTNSPQGTSVDCSDEHPCSCDLWLVLAQDITEQQQVAKELAAKNADLVQLNRMKDEFLACISHELKTPLTAVLGLSTLLKDQTLGELNERQARYARLIYQSGRQLMTVVNDILDLTRMETGQLELSLEQVQIQAVCDRAYAQAQQRPNEKDPDDESLPQTQFTLEIEPGLETFVADELRLRQMLVHLLANALKFTEPGGEIGLRVNRWEGWIAFTVWDTGIGIPPEKQHLIFQKFQQLEQPLTRRFEGTGLGLVLTQRLARLHGGDVSFISKLDEGSHFTLILPPCPPQGIELAASIPGFANTEIENRARGITKSPISNRLVLIVETVSRYLEELTEQLNNLGYRVVIARSGTEAIGKARSLQPCVVLLNPHLPQLSGWDVLTLLKSDAQTCHIPILVMGTRVERCKAYHNKADGFLSLPIQEQTLRESLNRLNGQQALTRGSLTILHLNPVDTDLGKSACFPESHNSSVLISELTDKLSLEHSELNYRILEADDLEQAELLTRVWQPDIVLLDNAGIVDPLAYLTQFSSYDGLSSLPLVTLDRQTTEAANQVSGLSVYPCLALDNASKIAALVQVIQVAAGMSRTSSILVMDIEKQKSTQVGEIHSSKIPLSLTAASQAGSRGKHRETEETIGEQTSQVAKPVTSHSSWLQALNQYLETAGFRSLLSRSWAEVYHQLQNQTVDLLLIRLKDGLDTSALIQGLISLNQLQKLPPILVLDHRSDGDRVSDSKAVATPPAELPLADAVTGGGNPNPELESLLNAVATRILRGSSLSMTQLLDHINQTLSQT